METPQSPRKVVLITGGSGLIGTRLARELSHNYQVVALDIEANPYPDKEVEHIGFDLTDDRSVEAAFARIRHAYGDKLASVVHLAAYYDFNGQENPLYDEITVGGTKRLLQQLRRHFRVEQFIFSSTNLIYAPVKPGQLISEDGEINPSWAYPESKVKTEAVIRADHGDIPVVIARIAGVYDEWGHSIPLSHQVERIYEKQLLGHLYSGDPDKGNPFIHLDDLIDALRRMVDQRQQLDNYEIFNIGEGITYGYRRLQDRIGELLHGREWTTIEVPKLLAKAGAAVQDAVGDPFIKPWMIDRADDHYQLDISRAATKLGWQPRHDLYRDLETMIANLQLNPEKWYQENKLDLPKSLK